VSFLFGGALIASESFISKIYNLFSFFQKSGISLKINLDASAIPGSLKSEAYIIDFEIFELVFGEDSVTPDSRQIRDLGKVVTEEESLNHLREHRDLAEALEIYKLKKDNNIESTAKLFAKSLESLTRLFSKISMNKENPIIIPLVERTKELLTMISKL
jgi:hypothetical protein